MTPPRDPGHDESSDLWMYVALACLVLLAVIIVISALR